MKTVKTLITLVLCFIMIATTGVTMSASAANISVTLNGNIMSFDQPPIIEDGRTLVPLRAIFEALGAEVGWEPSTQTITAVKDNTAITLKIGSNTLFKNGMGIQLDVPAKIIGDRTFVPVRAVAESFGAEVGWNANTQVVTISTSGAEPGSAANTTSVDSLASMLAPSVSLEEARKKPGLYVKEGDRFVPVQNPSKGMSINTGYSFSYLGVFMCDSDYQIPRIPNNAQLVLFSDTNIGIYETIDNGWALPIGIGLGNPSAANPRGWFRRDTESKLLEYDPPPTYSALYNRVDRDFETINGKEPTDFQDRMIYTSDFLLARYHGIFTGSRDEQFTFGWWQGTDWVEKTYTVDKRFFTFPASNYSIVRRADYEIAKTTNGYFEVVFKTLPSGYYAIGSSMGSLDRLVEFY